MKAIEITQPGGPEVLRVCDRPTPPVGPLDVLIRVAAAGVNRPDVQQRKGLYPPPPGASDIPGLDTAGIVEQVGTHVTRWRPGDRVCALSSGGGYAELCSVPQGQVLPVPAGLGLVEAASLPEVFFTAWHNVFQLSRLAAGETLLVHGGTSGVGMAAMQMARVLRDARVIATAGTAQKCRISEEYGAHHAVDYHGAWDAAVRDWAGPHGVDVILDSQAADYVALEVELLAIGGRLALIANHRGDHSTLRTRAFVQRSLTLTGAQIRRRDTDFKQKIADELVAQAWPELASGRIRTRIQSTFPLERADEAHAILDRNEQIGKVVLVVDPALA
ncbi:MULTISPECIES: NAD(P)H-quinone oxidoreductase [Ramlibacter]|uniref:Zinc-binding dehydrogenase n=1 Tax=Ramlibacter pinisoli TaxID=2682844 RepID=A0A6N8J1R5_9BURK|nr:MULTISPECIES: NAD(P)H-quinone oxidoreductase [Ramlibacter]MBA2962174.1 NAD(P)H-quinone oxidoreductase [Ramlibacter sp. CGMCC 1.13660]MVQ32116.1 zinc-binding dehydrogenase [Ramlibacter pinisoli]